MARTRSKRGAGPQICKSMLFSAARRSFLLAFVRCNACHYAAVVVDLCYRACWLDWVQRAPHAVVARRSGVHHRDVRCCSSCPLNRIFWYRYIYRAGYMQYIFLYIFLLVHWYIFFIFQRLFLPVICCGDGQMVHVLYMLYTPRARVMLLLFFLRYK